MDGPKSAIITDHPFEPRLKAITHIAAGSYNRTPEQLKADSIVLPPNPALCKHCRLAEAAHLESKHVEDQTSDRHSRS